MHIFCIKWSSVLLIVGKDWSMGRWGLVVVLLLEIDIGIDQWPHMETYHWFNTVNHAVQISSLRASYKRGQKDTYNQCVTQAKYVVV